MSCLFTVVAWEVEGEDAFVIRGAVLRRSAADRGAASGHIASPMLDERIDERPK